MVTHFRFIFEVYCSHYLHTTVICRFQYTVQAYSMFGLQWYILGRILGPMLLLGSCQMPCDLMDIWTLLGGLLSSEIGLTRYDTPGRTADSKELFDEGQARCDIRKTDRPLRIPLLLRYGHYSPKMLPPPPRSLPPPPRSFPWMLPPLKWLGRCSPHGQGNMLSLFLNISN